MTEIIINKKKYPVVVNMGTLITFEQVTNKSILSNDKNILTTMYDRMALIFAAILSADKHTKLTIGEAMDTIELQEFNAASVTVLDELAKFLHIPDIEAEKEKKTETSDDAKPKNASQPTTTTA